MIAMKGLMVVVERYLGRWCMNQFGTRTEPFGGPTYSPTIACDSGLPSSAIRFNTLHPIPPASAIRSRARKGCFRACACT